MPLRRFYAYLVSLEERSLGDLLTRLLEEIDSTVVMQRVNSMKLHFARNDVTRAKKRERSTLITVAKAAIQFLQVLGAQVGSSGANPRKDIEHTVIWNSEFLPTFFSFLWTLTSVKVLLS